MTRNMDQAVTSPSRLNVLQPLLRRTGCTVCAFGDQVAREHARLALQASDFDTTELTRLDARQMGERLVELKRDDPNSHDCCQRLDAALHSEETAVCGHKWLPVLASNDRHVLVAQRLLRAHGAQRAIHFGPSGIEDLVTRR